MFLTLRQVQRSSHDTTRVNKAHVIIKMAERMKAATFAVCFCLVFQVCLGVDSLRFLVIGDWGGLPDFPYHTPIETSVAKQMATITSKYGTSFNLALGDNFYFDGVKDADDKRFQETFERVYSESILSNPWYLVAGNHDHNGNVSAQIAYSSRSKRWNFPNYYYRLNFDIPGSKMTMDIVMIDTVLLCGNTRDDRDHAQPEGPTDLGASEDQWAWIEDQLKNSVADYLLVAGHFPVYSIAEHGPTKCLVDRLDPLLYKYRATTYLCGHDHNLQHLSTSSGDQTMDYFVIGAANFVEDSTKHSSSVPKGSSKFFWAELSELGGFGFVEATANNMTLILVDGEGKTLHQNLLLPRKKLHKIH